MCLYKYGSRQVEKGQTFVLCYVRLKARSNSLELSCSIVGRP